MFLRSKKIVGDSSGNPPVNKQSKSNYIQIFRNNTNTNTNTNNTNSKTTTCKGCIENQPNQLAHMDFGGCLEEKEIDLYAMPIIKIKRLEYEY